MTDQELLEKMVIEGQRLLEQEREVRGRLDRHAAATAGFSSALMERERCLGIVRELRRRAEKLHSGDTVDGWLQEAEDFIADPALVWRDEEPPGALPGEE